MSRSQLNLGFDHFVWSFIFGQYILVGFWLTYKLSIEIALILLFEVKVLVGFWLTYKLSIEIALILLFEVKVVCGFISNVSV